jgi:hypothetical protein
MLQSSAKPAFLTACACNLAFAIMGAATEPPFAAANILTMFGGAAAFITAMTLGVIILTGDGGKHHLWTKAALVFLALSPAAFWFLLWPAASTLVCIDCTLTPTHETRALGDILQSQVAMIAVALAALFCATRATTASLEELAV